MRHFINKPIRLILMFVVFSNIAVKTSAQEVVEIKLSSLKNFINNYNLSIQASVVAPNQTLDSSGFNSNFINKVNDKVNNHNVYGLGYSFGIRIDKQIDDFLSYTVSVSYNHNTTGVNYRNSKFNEILLGYYTDNVIGNDLYFTKLTPSIKFSLNNKNTHNLYFTIGPDFALLLNKRALEQNTTINYKSLFVNTNMGFDYDYKSNCALFMHYSFPLSSFGLTTKPTSLKYTEFSLGVALKTNFLKFIK